MDHFAPLIIHKSEWERIKNQAKPENEVKKKPKVDIEAMNALSQKWTSTWADSAVGQVNQAIKKKKKAHLEEMREVEAFHKKKKKDNTVENVKKARNMIFERTGYGRELLSALIESKTLEERELQIKFKKEIKEKEKKLEETKSKVENIMYAEFQKGEKDRVLKKQEEKAAGECNRIVAEMKKEEAVKAAEIELKNRHEDAVMIEKLRQLEIAKEKHNNCIDKEAVKLYEEQNRAIKDMREQREALDQMLADSWQKHQDRVRCKEKKMFDKIHKEKHDTGHFKENYELVQRLLEEERKKYNDFIEKGVTRLEKRLQKKEKEEKIKRDQDRKSKTLQAQCMQVTNQRERENCEKRMCGDKQSFLPTPRRGSPKAKLIKDQSRSQPLYRPLRSQFLAPSTALRDALAWRKTQPSGWTGTAASHEQFAQHAAATLKQAAFKRPVQKVIESYCKTNNVQDLQTKINENICNVN